MKGACGFPLLPVKRAKDDLAAMVFKILQNIFHSIRIVCYYGTRYIMLPILGSPCYSSCSIESHVAVAT